MLCMSHRDPEYTEKPVCTCENCKEGIYEGDDYYNIPGYGDLCEDCIKEFAATA